MNTEEIYKFLAEIFRKKHIYYNVIPCDYLNKIDYFFPFCIVVNSDRSDMPGSHWIGLYCNNKNSSVVFVDSYGQGINFYDIVIKNFVESIGNGLIENRVPLQSWNSDVCGEYVIWFMYKLFNGCCLMTLYCNFGKNRILNDILVKKFVRSRLKYIHSNPKLMNNVNQCCKKFILK
jgi:hypothetical protein